MTSLPDPVLHRRRSVRIGIRLRHSAPRSLMNAGVLRRCRRGARLATTHGSATWPDALRPVHRHNEGARELSIGWRSSTIAVALRQKEQRRRQTKPGSATVHAMPDTRSRRCSGSDTRASTDAGRARVAAAERARRQKQVASKHWRLPAARPSRSRATIALRLIERWCRTIAMPHESSHDTRATGKGVIQQRALYGRRGSYHAPAVVGAYDRFRAEVAVSPASASASTGWSGCRLVTTRRLRWRPPRGG